MERLTERNHVYQDYEFMDSGMAEYMNKLAKFEDLEDQELLWKLPVHIGEKCFLVGKAECEICPYVSDESYDCKICPEGIFECELGYLILNRIKEIYATRKEAEEVWNNLING